jgi:hypothetical protein
MDTKFKRYFTKLHLHFPSYKQILYFYELIQKALLKITALFKAGTAMTNVVD